MHKDILRQINSTNFILEDDLFQLKKVIQINAIEAIVFYSGRILEATSKFCMIKLGEKSRSDVFANIEYINDYNLLDSLTRHWAHALRRLANQFRHILKPTEHYDGQIAVILLDMWLDWLINESKLIQTDTTSFSLLKDTQNDIAQQFKWVGDWMQKKNLRELNVDDNPTLLTQPVFASIICEELINTKEFVKAKKYLTTALKHHPHDLRLNQLKGLCLKREGSLIEAEILLQKLLKQMPNDDETIGILAGTIKEIWQQGDESRLRDWGKLYHKGWKSSKGKNTYLGINAATYSLWSGAHLTSKKIATQIVQQYNHRKKTLKKTLGLNTDEMNYWDQATYAEACLLAGLTTQAEQGYKELFSDKFKGEPHEIPAKQLKQHLAEPSVLDSALLEKLVQESYLLTAI